MKQLIALTRRNIKLFFSDKGMFFTALITPLILLVLYATFLGNVYRDSLLSAVADGIEISDRIADSVVSGQLMSSILAVSCITVAFCSNLLSVQDKVTGARRDLDVSPVSKTILSLSYYLSTLVSTLLICYVATGACIGYCVVMDAYFGLYDALMIFVDVTLLSMFGTAFSSVVVYFLSSQGQMSAVGSIVSSCYGFICGAYMPISQFSPALQKVISFLPGTYATSLVRNHALGKTFEKMAEEGVPAEFVETTKDTFDLNVYFLGDKVSVGNMYAILGASVILLVGIYVLMNVLSRRKNK